MKQVTDLIQIESSFHYTGTNYDSLDELRENILNYQAVFNSMEWTKEELNNISKQLVEVGRTFAEQQGFAPGNNFTESGIFNSVDVPELYALRPGNTGRLYHGIKSNVEKNGVRFYNDARNDRGQPYAGHLEYGFHDRGGNLVPARPFMRPAFYAVSEASKGNFRGIMKGLLDNMWQTRGYMGISQLSFGHKYGSQSIFWKNPSAFAEKMANRGRLSEISGKNFRQRMTTSNRFKYGTGSKKGFNIRKNQKEFHRMSTPSWSRSKNWGRTSGRSYQSEKNRAKRLQEEKDREDLSRKEKQERQRRNSRTISRQNTNPRKYTSERVGQGSDRRRYNSKTVSKPSGGNDRKKTTYMDIILVNERRFGSSDYTKTSIPIGELKKYSPPKRKIGRKVLNKYGRNKPYLKKDSDD